MPEKPEHGTNQVIMMAPPPQQPIAPQPAPANPPAPAGHK